MENRKFLIFEIIILSFLFFLPLRAVFAYGVDTHAYLTDESIKLYSQNFSGDKISSDLTNYLLDGARQEDNTPRWMNHFYDPVYDRGLSFDSKIDPLYVGYWEKSKDWVNDSSSQNEFKYKVPTAIGSVLTAAQQKNIGAITTETDFTWDKAIRYYVRGEKEQAMYMLGHILHLVQDTSVPDHTRNDPHPGDSVYEDYTSKFNLDNPDSDLEKRLSGKTALIFNDLGSYFNELAKYSNNNFYTKDTINKEDVYVLPKVINFEFKNGLYYGVKEDEFGKLYIVLDISSGGNTIENNTHDFSIKDGLVKNSYWSRLSAKSVQYSAGVIDLFFREAEKAANDPNFVRNEPKSFLAQVLDTTKGYVFDIFDKLGNLVSRFNFSSAETAGDLKLVTEINLVDKNNDNISWDNRDSAGTSVDSQNNVGVNDKNNLSAAETKFTDEQDEDAAEKLSQVNTDKQLTDKVIDINKDINKDVVAGQNQIQSAQVCAFNTSKVANRQKLIINEVAWMGGPVSANDEWIELKNISGSELDISGWQLLDKDEQIKITFSQNTKLKANEFLLLERTDDDSVPGIKANLIYSGALSNTSEGLRLFDSKCDLADEVLADSNWPAGDPGARRTMERSGDLTWHTYSANGESWGGVMIMGTPKYDNSPATIFSSGGVSATASGSGATTNSQQQTNSNQQSPAKILVSEVQITGGTGKTDNDFIELYNPNSIQVNLRGYRLVKRTKTGTSDAGIKSWTEDSFIPAKGYYLWANSDYTDIGVEPDVKTSVTLANDNGVAIRFGAQDEGVIVDSVGWGGAKNVFVETAPFADNPITNQSISRQSENDSDNNAVDFIESKPTPKNSKISGGFSPPDLWVESSAADVLINHVVISEVYPDRTGANQDFIELYNAGLSGGEEIDISKWSIQVLSANAESLEKIKKKNFEEGNKISSRGFFLIGLDGYPAADLNWTSGSLNSTGGATVFLVNSTTTISGVDDARIVDRIAYGSGSGLVFPENLAVNMPQVGKSLERRAYSDGQCVSSGGEGEFLGNGCDDDDNQADFELRPVPNPQSISSLSEPRSAPIAVSNFSVNYSSTTLEIFLNWDSSRDYRNDSSSLRCFINYATSSANDLKPLAEIYNNTSFSFKADEVGVTYYFSIFAKDKDGLASSATAANLNVPSLLKDAYFYKDSRDAGVNKYFVELYYDTYPFIPDVYRNSEQDSWKVLNFTLSKEVWGVSDENESGYLENGLDIVYDSCAGTKIYSPFIILPDNEKRCGVGGGVENSALKFEYLEDKHLLFELATTSVDAFTEKDFITIGFSSLYHSGGGSQDFKSVTTDKRKYYFQNYVPVHQPPNSIQNVELKFDEDTSLLRIIWDRALDPDTLDRDIKYEINYVKDGKVLDDNNWQDIPMVNLEPLEYSEVGNNPFTKIIVEPGAKYLIGLRAVDDFGNKSEVVTREFAVPAEEVCFTDGAGDNQYFKINCVKIKDNQLKIKWSLLKRLNIGAVFSIIPFLSNENISPFLTGRALHKDKNGNADYPLTTASETGECNAKITSIGAYEIGKVHTTSFQSISGISVDMLAPESKIKFSIYAGAPCSVESGGLFFADDNEYSVY